MVAGVERKEDKEWRKEKETDERMASLAASPQQTTRRNKQRGGCAEADGKERTICVGGWYGGRRERDEECVMGCCRCCLLFDVSSFYL